jgi:hypothetical protein
MARTIYEVSYMTTSRKNRTAFRPSLIDIRLEDRVALSGGAGSSVQVASFTAATPEV